MTSLILLTLMCDIVVADAAQLDGPAHFNLLAMQDRIVLKRGEGGGVTIKPDPNRPAQSYSHSSRPLFGSQTGYAARRSTQRYTPPPPLITSREVARGAVRRSVYGNRWGW
jgi:hypothetical protein